MPGNHPPVTLRVDPSSIVALRASVEVGIDELNTQLLRLGMDGYIPEAWLGDPVSASLLSHYNTTVMDSPDGPYAALKAYEAELIKIRDNLQLLEDHYRRTEGDNAALWGRA